MTEPASSAPRTTRGWVVVLLRVLLGVFPVVWVLRTVELGAVARSVAVLGAGPLLVAALSPFASILVSPVRWAVLLRAYGAPSTPGYFTLLRHLLVGFYYNALPGAVAGDALRAYRTRGVLRGTVDSAAVVVADRIAGLAGLLLLGSLSLLGGVPEGGARVLRALGFGAVLGGALVVAVFVSPALYGRLVGRPSSPGLWSRIDGWIRRVPPPEQPARIVLAVLLSLLTQGAPMAQITWLVHALSPATPVVDILRVVPGLILLVYIPITPGAVGQREFVFVHLLGSVGVRPEPAVAASIVVLATATGLTLVGGAVHLWESVRPGRAD